MYGPEFEKLIELLRQLPGIGKKQSEKIAFHILNLDAETLKELLTTAKKLNTSLNKCNYCNNITINTTCDICLNPKRNNKLMIVESVADLNKFEALEIYEGKYYIFDQPFENFFGKQAKKLEEAEFNQLKIYAQNFPEVVLSLSPTLEGEIISSFLTKMISSNKTKVTQLAHGIPIGSQVEYIDPFTLKQALINRKTLK